MNIRKNESNYERYFERLSAESSVQNSFRVAAATVEEIVVKRCSRVLLGLLTTGKSDSYVTDFRLHIAIPVYYVATAVPGI